MHAITCVYAYDYCSFMHVFLYLHFIYSMFHTWPIVWCCCFAYCLYRIRCVVGEPGVESEQIEQLYCLDYEKDKVNFGWLGVGLSTDLHVPPSRLWKNLHRMSTMITTLFHKVWFSNLPTLKVMYCGVKWAPSKAHFIPWLGFDVHTSFCITSLKFCAGLSSLQQ